MDNTPNTTTEQEIEKPIEQLHYEEGCRLQRMTEVLLQPKDIAEVYRKAAEEMREAGQYQDAPQLAAEFEEKAGRVLAEGTEAFYLRACEKAQSAKTDIERKMAIDMLQRVGDYRDAPERLQECLLAEHKEHQRRTMKMWLAAIVAAMAVAAVVFAATQEARRDRLAGEAQQTETVETETAETVETETAETEATGAADAETNK